MRFFAEGEIFCVISHAKDVYIVRVQIRAVTDEDLAARVAGHASEAACTELFSRYNRRIYLWCFNYTHDAEEAVDLTQEIFIKIFKNIDGFAGLSKFSTWVYGITRNHCLGELSKKKRTWWKRMKYMDEKGHSFAADEGMFDEIERMGDLELILGQAKDVMDDGELEAFILHYWEGLPVNEITRILGCRNVTGARTLIQNARRKFRRLIKEKGFCDE
jgi:RNA polymerase sigma-70 factor (ECF subfamily)